MENKFGYVRIVTFIYVLALLVTIAVMLLMGVSFAKAGHTWISFGALFLAETFIYGVAVGYVANSPFTRKIFPGYLGLGTIAGLYLIVVIVLILVFSWILDVSTYSYALLHFIAMGIAAILAGLMMIYIRNAGLQDISMELEVPWVTDMCSVLLLINQELDGWNNEAKSSVLQAFKELDEKVRFSDPLSHPKLAGTEKSLLAQAYQLSTEIREWVEAGDAEGQAEKIMKQIRGITNQVTIRNQQLIQLK